MALQLQLESRIMPENITTEIEKIVEKTIRQ
jgi:hypothetical protein